MDWNKLWFICMVSSALCALVACGFAGYETVTDISQRARFLPLYFIALGLFLVGISLRYIFKVAK